MDRRRTATAVSALSTCLAAVLGFLAEVAPTRAAEFRVGVTGSTCTHATLAAAVAAAAANGPGADGIRVSSTQTVSATIDFGDQSLTIAGGYANCDAAAPTATTLITITADPGFRVPAAAASRTVELQGLQVIRSGAGGRILDLQGPAFVIVGNSLLSNGAATDGANVRMAGNVILFLDAGANVYSGDATGNGGGIHCSGGGTILAAQESSVSGNTAGGDGGGLYLNDCLLNLFAGSTGDITCPNGGPGVVCNQADDFGGGIYAGSGSTVNLIGNETAPALLAGNSANAGGGLYADGTGVEVTATDSWITDNSATIVGGGVFVHGNASFEMSASELDCRGNLRCSQLSGNRASGGLGTGGGLAANLGAQATILQTSFSGNTAAVTGSVLWADGSGTTVDLEGLVVRDNGGSTNATFFETDLGAELRVGFSTIDEAMGCCRGLFDTNGGSSVSLFSSILLAISDANGQGKIFTNAIGAGETRIGDCLLHREHTSTLPPPLDPSAYESVAMPDLLFVNRPLGDLHLRRGSQAQDFCDAFAYVPLTTDIDRDVRGWDDPTVPNTRFGSLDLGADEWRPLLVADHEGGNCGQWSATAGGC